jgi:hypothetical protein
VVFHVCDCTGGGGRLGRLTHCGDADCLLGSLPSIRVLDEEDIEKLDDEAITQSFDLRSPPNIDYVIQIFSVRNWMMFV